MANKIIGVLSNDSLKTELARNAANELDSINWDSSAEKICNLYNNKGVLVNA